MGIQAIPAYINKLVDGVTAVQHPTELDRNLLEAQFGGRTGVLRYGQFALTPTGVSQQLSIAQGTMFINGQETAQQGGYFAWSDVAETKNFGAPSGSPRIDTLLLRVYDPQYGTLPSGDSRVQWDVVAGTPAATPAARPDSDFLSGGSQYVPGAWAKWAEVRINPGDTTIPAGQIYIPGSVSGGTGVVWGPRLARFGGLTVCHSIQRPTDAQRGDRIHEYDTGYTYAWNTTLSKWIRDEVVDWATTDSSWVSNTTLRDPDGFPLMQLEANCKYVFEYTIYLLTDVAVDAKVAMRVPSGATMRWSTMPAMPSSATTEQSISYFGSTTSANPGYVVGGYASTSTGFKVQGIIFNGATAGSASVQMAQAVSSGVSGLTTFTGSHLRWKQVG